MSRAEGESRDRDKKGTPTAFHHGLKEKGSIQHTATPSNTGKNVRPQSSHANALEEQILIYHSPEGTYPGYSLPRVTFISFYFLQIPTETKF